MSWKYTLDLSDVWIDTEDAADPRLTEARSKVVNKVNLFLAQYHLEGEADIDEVMEEMTDAANADDMDWFNDCWNVFYDFADAYRIWVKVW